ncbi:MAG: type III pantothenate kinase [Verrucomicrobiales bacterium]|nr:type III pantothenate kinase [Verrucomicrobiales bacterium]
MILLLDVGNTHTHLGLANNRRVVRQTVMPTPHWRRRDGLRAVRDFAGAHPVTGTVFCSVVPAVDPALQGGVKRAFGLAPLKLDHRTVRGVGVRYAKPDTIGADRLANAVAARIRFGAPVVVVDLGTAVTLDVVDARGDYIGGIIGPGLSAMTDYLHEKTALLPRVSVRAVRRTIGRNTEEAMLIGAVKGYRHLISGLLEDLRHELASPELPVVFTGGCAQLVARGIAQVSAVAPDLTLEGLRLVWQAHHPTATTSGQRGGREG